MECGSIFVLKRGRGNEDSGRCGAGKCKTDYKVSGNRNPPPSPSPFRDILEQVRGNRDM